MKNFASNVSLSFAELVTKFEDSLLEHSSAEKKAAEAFKHWQLLEEQAKLLKNYKSLFSSMLHKMLNAKPEETSKIKLAFSEKVQKVLNDLQTVENKLNGTAKLESRDTISDKISHVENLLSRAELLEAK